MRHQFAALRLASLAVAIGVGLVRPSDLGARADATRIYLTVVDAKGKPVTGLTAADFEVRIDDTLQEVLGLATAVEPASVLILTDRLGLNSTYTAFDTGQALKDFVKAIRTGSPDSKIALTTFDGTTMQVTKFTSPPAELDHALGRLGSMTSDAVLLDGLADAARTMRGAPTDRRVILVLLAAYRSDQSGMQTDLVGEMLRLSQASIWALEVRQAQGGNVTNPTREQVLDAGAALSGGTRELVASRSGVTASLKRMADLILSQYALTYGATRGSSQSTLTVTVKRPDVKILSPRWTTR